MADASKALKVLDGVKTQDLAKSVKSLATGNNGRIRSEMPQLDDPAAFCRWLRDRGVDHVRKSVACSELRPTQKHFKTEKVKAIVESIKNGESGPDKVLLTARGKIVDGHHRWAAHRMVSKGSPVSVCDIDAEPDEVIRMANKFGARREKLASAFTDALSKDASEHTPSELERAEMDRGSRGPDPEGDDAPKGGKPSGISEWFESAKRKRLRTMAEIERRYGNRILGASYD